MSIEAVDTRARGLRPRGAAEKLGIRGALGRLDWVLLGALAATAAYGLWAIDGITKLDPGGSAASRQGIYAGVGLVLMAVAIFVDPQVYRRFAGVIYVALLAVMTLVLATGAVTRGSRRWSTWASSASSRPSSARS